MELHLTKREIDSVFVRRNKEKWQKLIVTYEFLRANLVRAHASEIFPEYSRKFNYFYQVRRNAAWRGKFYPLLFKYREVADVEFAPIFEELFHRTGQVEMSFASKLAATINPDLPVIDRHVLSYINEKPPTPTRDARERIANIIELHKNMHQAFSAFLDGPHGRYIAERFEAEYPGANVGKMKMLDFILWQSGGRSSFPSSS